MPNKPIVPFVTTTTAKRWEKKAQETALSSKPMLKKIENNLRERMSGYTDSRQPTDDEVRLAWLIAEIDKLHHQLEKHPPIKSSVSINSYPSNYVEEELPQVIVEIRYKKDCDPSDTFRKEEAETMANKIETFIK